MKYIHTSKIVQKYLQKRLVLSILEYIINRKCIESINYVGIMTTVKKLLKFSVYYSRTAAANMLLYEDKTQSVDSFKAENEFETPLFALKLKVCPNSLRITPEPERP